MDNELNIFGCPLCSFKACYIETVKNHIKNDHDVEILDTSDDLQTSSRELVNEDLNSNTKNISTIWTKKNTLLFLNIVEQHYNLFDSAMKKQVWTKIAGEMHKQTNLPYTATQCDTKFKGMKKTYKNVKDHNNRSGNNKKSWEYFEVMDNFMATKPEVVPAAICSSETGLKVLGENEENEEVVPRKRKSTNESSVERRHKEKMARQDRFLDLLEKLLNK